MNNVAFGAGKTGKLLNLELKINFDLINFF